MGLVPDGPTMCDRPVVLYLHGGPGFDHSFLKHFLLPLQQEAQLVFLDHRGQGRSDESTPDRWNLDTWIEDVQAFCECSGSSDLSCSGNHSAASSRSAWPSATPICRSSSSCRAALRASGSTELCRSSSASAARRRGPSPRPSLATLTRRTSRPSWRPACRSITQRRWTRTCSLAFASVRR